MTNSRFRNNGQPINIAVAIRRAGKHENDVDAAVAEQGHPLCTYIGVLVTIDQNGRRRGSHKDTDGVSFVANIYAIPYPYTSPVGSFVPPGFSSGRETGCYLNFPFRSCNSCVSSPFPFPTINYNEATISVSTDTEFRFPPGPPIL